MIRYLPSFVHPHDISSTYAHMTLPCGVCPLLEPFLRTGAGGGLLRDIFHVPANAFSMPGFLKTHRSWHNE